MNHTPHTGNSKVPVKTMSMKTMKGSEKSTKKSNAKKAMVRHLNIGK